MDKAHNKERYERKRKYKNREQQRRRRYGDEYQAGFGGNV